jgi:hypothetical protein
VYIKFQSLGFGVTEANLILAGRPSITFVIGTDFRVALDDDTVDLPSSPLSLRSSTFRDASAGGTVVKAVNCS